MNETEITARIKTYLKGIAGLFFWKEHGGTFGTNGIPDLIVCYRGRFIALEVKTDNGKATALQEVTIRQIRGAGGIAEVVRSVGAVAALIDGISTKESRQ
jgi:hypothetical protein